MTGRRCLTFALFAALLGVIAAASASPHSTDRDVYERIGRAGVALDCDDVHCFRPLVAVLLEHLPGPSLLRWRIYAVVTSAAAAIALGRLTVLLGFSARVAGFAMWIAAFGSGPLQSVFDPYTSDPLMYLLGPLMVADLFQNRGLRATALGSIGVLAKEFAAAPLWVFTLFSVLQRKWADALRMLAAALFATLVWFTLHTLLMTLYNNRYGTNPSVDLLGGGYFRAWTEALGPGLAGAYLFMAFGALYVLFPVGLTRAARPIRLLAWSCLPAAAAFVYVQQPDRALWNFHFIVIPLAAAILARLPDWPCWIFIVCFGAANIRLGSPQPALVTVFRVGLVIVSTSIAVMAVTRRDPGLATS